MQNRKAVKRQQRMLANQKCGKCGNIGHLQADCPYKAPGVLRKPTGSR